MGGRVLCERASLAVSMFAVVVAGTALAGPLEDAETAQYRGDYAGALRLLRPLADDGNAAAQNALGAMYGLGRGVPLDYAEAVKWYRKAADQGNAAAQYNLGVAYANGLGVWHDNAEALKWYRKAADQGDADAQKLVREWKPIGQPLAAADPPTSASAGVGPNTALEVGRVTLRLSDDGWENVGAGQRGLAYTGDQSGDIKYETVHLLLRGNAGEFRAALVVGASRGIGSVHFTWTTNCQAGPNLYVVDSAGGNFRGSDCLRVSGITGTQRFLESAEPGLLAELTARKVILPNTAYVVIHEKAIENGAFTFVRGVFAADFKLPTNSRTQSDLPTGVTPEAVAWGMRLAEAVRSSIYSLSGALLIPPVKQTLSTAPPAEPDGIVPSTANAVPPAKPAIRRGVTKISGADPTFPRAAIAAGIERGYVVSRVQIDETGNVYGVTIIKADPPGHFDQAVIEALREWKFQGDGNKYVGEIEINFELK